MIVVAHKASTFEWCQTSWAVFHISFVERRFVWIEAAVDEYLRTVLVITCRQCAGGIGALYQSITEAVALGLMLDGIIKKVFPKFLTKDIFFINLVFKNIS